MKHISEIQKTKQLEGKLNRELRATRKALDDQDKYLLRKVTTIRIVEQ